LQVSAPRAGNRWPRSCCCVTCVTLRGCHDALS
jgi:hypothetical protein